MKYVAPLLILFLVSWLAANAVLALGIILIATLILTARYASSQGSPINRNVLIVWLLVGLLLSGFGYTQEKKDRAEKAELVVREQEARAKERQIKDLVDKAVLVECKNHIIESQGALNILSNVRQGGSLSGNFTEDQAKQMFRKYQDELKACEEFIANRIRSAHGLKP